MPCTSQKLLRCRNGLQSKGAVIGSPNYIMHGCCSSTSTSYWIVTYRLLLRWSKFVIHPFKVNKDTWSWNNFFKAIWAIQKMEYLVSCLVLLTILCVSNVLFVLFAKPDFLVKSKMMGCKYISHDGCSSKFGRLLFFLLSGKLHCKPDNRPPKCK